jgi:thymidine phosphorylase
MCIMKEEPPSSAFECTYYVLTHVHSSPEGVFERMSTSAETLAFHVKGPRRTELEALRSNAHIAFERTRDDLVAREKTLVLVYIYHFVFFCKRWEVP